MPKITLLHMPLAEQAQMLAALHRGDRIPGRRGYGGVLLVPCLLHAAYRSRLAKPTRTRYCLASLPIRVVHLSCLLVAQQIPQYRLCSII